MPSVVEVGVGRVAKCESTDNGFNQVESEDHLDDPERKLQLTTDSVGVQRNAVTLVGCQMTSSLALYSGNLNDIRREMSRQRSILIAICLALANA